MRQLANAVTILVVGTFGAIGCAPAADAPEADAPAADQAPAVNFTLPDTGATVTSPFEACFEATGISIEPSGDVVEGVGHFHLIVDPSADERGELLMGEPVAVPNDETHLHLGDGSSCVMVETTPGEHTIMVVVTDGAHVNLSPPILAEMTVSVQ